MTATFRLEPGELNDSFFEKLRTMFRDREVELVVYDVEEKIEYPFDNPAQVKFLEEELEAVERGDGLVTFNSIEELRRHTL